MTTSTPAPISEDTLRQALADSYRRLADLGLNTGSAGNISCRFDGGALISPAGADAHNIDAQAIVSITMDGENRSPGIPSSEWSMHTAIYRHFPQAMAVVHTHSDACVAVSAQRRPIPAFHYMLAGFGGDEVPCAAYATFGTDALAASAVEALAGHTACLLANHGMICHALSLEKAVANAAKLETLARQYWMSAQLGTPVVLDAAEMATVRDRYRSYGKARLSRTPGTV
ncbi:class II aldolase/adducin family protein [Pseudacidovorax intermedius]|uniref:L-fuculose-phosphate aldolase n=1 Tax=Pseudacidovorax intermedius TaxID=433924 RepID=A0A370FBL2_9BURK|nr:class II aldolase/adducin family protein [Pseudacidovorax intermedius]RDI22626.1 L-fuculose-phosphate aldolase [Pseudacidovorax intermedius]